jgi:hypothetical protein
MNIPFMNLNMHILSSKSIYKHDECIYENFGVIRSGKSKNDGQFNGQKKKDKQWSIKHYIEN